MKLGKFAGVLAAIAVSLSGAHAQEYPNRLITIVAGIPPGGPGDVFTRAFAEKMRESLKVPIVVENRPGNAGQISFEYVRAAAPDGYTLVVSNPSLAALKYTTKSFTMDPLADLTHIGMMYDTPIFVVTSTAASYRNLPEFFTYARNNPEKINFASVGGSLDLDIALLMTMAKARFTVVRYKSSVQIQPAMLNGELDATFFSYRNALTLAEQGKVRIIGAASAARFPLLPNVPTVAEEVPGYEATSNWYGLSGPAGMPRAVITKISDALRAAAQVPDVKKRLNDVGFESVGGTPDELRTRVARDLERLGRAAKLTGLQPE